MIVLNFHSTFLLEGVHNRINLVTYKSVIKLIYSNQIFIVHLFSKTNCNKFYCNLTFYKLNTYLILTSACLVLWSKNVSTDKNFLRNILVTRGDPFVCACPRLRSSRCRQTIVESSSLYFWSPENKLCGEVGWVYPCEDKVSI